MIHHHPIAVYYWTEASLVARHLVRLAQIITPPDLWMSYTTFTPTAISSAFIRMYKYFMWYSGIWCNCRNSLYRFSCLFLQHTQLLLAHFTDFCFKELILISFNKNKCFILIWWMLAVKNFCWQFIEDFYSFFGSKKRNVFHVSWINNTTSQLPD